MSEIRHGGCADCKATDQPILTSVPNFVTYLGKALCDVCLAKWKKEQQQ